MDRDGEPGPISGLPSMPAGGLDRLQRHADALASLIGEIESEVTRPPREASRPAVGRSDRAAVATPRSMGPEELLARAERDAAALLQRARDDAAAVLAEGERLAALAVTRALEQIDAIVRTWTASAPQPPPNAAVNGHKRELRLKRPG